VLCEAAGLHLVWYHDLIFVKPIPRYLLSTAFWTFGLETGILLPTTNAKERDNIFAAIFGFLRSYTYLIRYPADLKMAQKLDLLPEGLSLAQFRAFIEPFANVEDSRVNPRYHYGELRLSRINFYTPILLFPKLTYHYMTPQWQTMFGAIVAPLLSVFAVLSVTLSAMQVEIGIQAIPEPDARWKPFSDISRWFSVVTLFIVAVIMAGLILLGGFMFAHEILFALKILWRKRGGRAERKVAYSAVI
jgi:hypothetical protein